MKRKATKWERIKAWAKRNSEDIVLTLLLIFAFPVGLYAVWRRDCEWRRWLKALVSVAWVAIILSAVLLLPSIDQYQSSGNVQIVSKKANMAILGPGKPEQMPDTAQVIRSASENSSLITQPTPTPDPIMVYCNNNGIYYHTADCRFVYDTTPRVRLLAALQAGKTACPECNPPNEMTY